MSTNHVSVRLDAATMARVDALAPMFSTKWRVSTRSDILRGLILTALDLFEQGEAPREGDKPRAAPAAKPKRATKPKR